MEKERRHKAIQQLLSGEERIANQAALLERLASQMKIHATQATISRDLREMGVVRTPGGYMLPDRFASAFNGHAMPRTTIRTLGRALTHVVDTIAAGTVVVVRTFPGHASAIAAEIDSARLGKIVGTLAGEDTIFLATASVRDAASVAREIRFLYEADGAGEAEGALQKTSSGSAARETMR